MEKAFEINQIVTVNSAGSKYDGRQGRITRINSTGLYFVAFGRGRPASFNETELQTTVVVGA